MKLCRKLFITVWFLPLMRHDIVEQQQTTIHHFTSDDVLVQITTYRQTRQIKPSETRWDKLDSGSVTYLGGLLGNASLCLNTKMFEQKCVCLTTGHLLITSAGYSSQFNTCSTGAPSVMVHCPAVLNTYNMPQ